MYCMKHTNLSVLSVKTLTTWQGNGYSVVKTLQFNTDGTFELHVAGKKVDLCAVKLMLNQDMSFKK